jgi:tRNA threonylcarbamoyl adenosine modification protein (Sua5/YciO/YrdC/YwlC family)
VTRYDCSDEQERASGLEAAVAAVRAGSLVVLPTDTVYGVGADAFSPAAVDGLLAAKGRGRDMPTPVLVGRRETLDGLVTEMPRYARDLVDAFWPGALTVVVRHTPSLAWDLGETRGTVALRMPLHPVALDLLAETGPLAVSSANRSGSPPATTADEAQAQLGDAVAVYLAAGRCADPVPSTIVDCTAERPRLLRAGALRLAQLREVAPVTDD